MDESNDTSLSEHQTTEKGKLVDGDKSKKLSERTEMVEKNNESTGNGQPNNAMVSSGLPLDWTKLSTGPSDHAPASKIRYPLDVFSAKEFEEDEIYAVGTHGVKITHMGPDLYQHAGPNAKKLILRSHLITKMEGLSEGWKKLELLELYDNQIEYMTGLENVGPGLIVLDMSYNVIRDMAPIQCCSNLVELYLANNKLKTLAGFENMTKLKRIDLGANRFRTMDPAMFANLVNLEELWLGKNKIERIQGLETLTKLRKLDIQSNRLTKIDDECLSHVAFTLEELYLAHNGLDDDGAGTLLNIEFKALTTIDLSRNRLTTTKPFSKMFTLSDLWISSNQIENFEGVEPLSKLGTRDDANLETIYLEYNPLDKDPQYRKKLQQMIPSLKQIDANMIVAIPQAQTLSNRGGGPVVLAETLEEKMRRLQGIAVAKAEKETLERNQNPNG